MLKLNNAKGSKAKIQKTCLGVVFLISLAINGSSSAEETDDWSITIASPYSAEVTLVRTAAHLTYSTRNVDQKKQENPASSTVQRLGKALRPMFNKKLVQDNKVGWQVNLFSNAGIAHTESDDTYGLSFSRTW